MSVKKMANKEIMYRKINGKVISKSGIQIHLEDTMLVFSAGSNFCFPLFTAVVGYDWAKTLILGATIGIL